VTDWTFAVSQPLRAKQPPQAVPLRLVLLERPVGVAFERTRSGAPLMEQIKGWGVVAGIFAAAVFCWLALVAVGLLAWRMFLML